MAVAHLLSVNVGAARAIGPGPGVSGIDKRPVLVPVRIRLPEPGGSGLVGDQIGDHAGHGGADQAIYAYAREDLDRWEAELGRRLPCGTFGENLTTAGLDVTGALIGERWRVGEEVLLQVTAPRIPCRTFATWMGLPGWVKTFTQGRAPGTYLRVLQAGEVRTGDLITVEHRPDHRISVEVAFRALTDEPELLPQLAAVEDLPEALGRRVRRRLSAGAAWS
ncbi:MAG TPA: MOSC domain-containing protein [Candidatus Dormibacteraeota bacterium]|nr:MOSC domain-containing protein [Candidatus Dormibacteraeota bacterium]